MGRVLLILFFILIAGYGLDFLFTYNQRLAIEASEQDASADEAVADASPQNFNETGTLVFYPNNVGPVPYLFYRDAKGRVVSKALVFPSPASVGGSWSGSRISVTGDLVFEHVVVARATYISGP